MKRTNEELAEWGIEHGGMMLREIQESDPRMVSPEVRALAEFAVEAARRLREMPEGERIEGFVSELMSREYDGDEMDEWYVFDLKKTPTGPCPATLILHKTEGGD